MRRPCWDFIPADWQHLKVVCTNRAERFLAIFERVLAIEESDVNLNNDRYNLMYPYLRIPVNDDCLPSLKWMRFVVVVYAESF